MSIGVVTVDYLIKHVAERWRHQYQQYPQNFFNWRSIYEKLKALPETATAADVNAAIGNDSWTRLTCDECHKNVDQIVAIHPEHADGITYICPECLKKALAEVDYV